MSTGASGNGDSGDGPLPDDDPWARPPGVSDETVEAVGTLSASLEWIERARGRLFDFHQMLGRADNLLGEAIDQLRQAGHDEQADRLEETMLGRNVLFGRWTYQVVEEFEDQYYNAFRDEERKVREDLMAGKRHVFEAEFKERRRTPGVHGHERRPPVVKPSD